MFNIQEFTTSIATDGTQFNSHFDVQITLPPIMFGKVSQSGGMADMNFLDNSRILSMRCDNAIIPGIALKTRMNNRYGIGPYEKYPYGSGVTDINLSFIQDKNGFISTFFYTWLNLITNFSDPNELYGNISKRYVTNFKDDYSTYIVINRYDMFGQKIASIILTKAYPTSMNDYPVSWSDNSLTRITAGFTFRDWYFDDTKTKNISDLNKFFTTPDPLPKPAASGVVV